MATEIDFNNYAKDTMDPTEIGNILTKAKEQKKLPEIKTQANQAMVTKEQSQNFVAHMANKRSVEFINALMGISLICQKGGTASKATGDIYATVDGTTYTLKELRDVIEKHFDKKFTLRQWARTNATLVYKISYSFSTVGDLDKKILRAHPEHKENLEFRCWLSNFQMDNPECPELARDCIKEHFKSTFPNNKKVM